MTLDEYNSFCASLPATTHVVQWDGAHVWKVGGKVFAIANWWSIPRDKPPNVIFKPREMSYDLLKGEPGCRPAPYYASRGIKWLERTSTETLDDAAFRDYLRESHRLVVAGLTRKKRVELGLG